MKAGLLLLHIGVLSCICYLAVYLNQPNAFATWISIILILSNVVLVPIIAASTLRLYLKIDLKKSTASVT